MIGRALWWLACRALGPGLLVSEEMLDAVDVVVREQALEWGVVLPAGET